MRIFTGTPCQSPFAMGMLSPCLTLAASYVLIEMLFMLGPLIHQGQVN